MISGNSTKMLVEIGDGEELPQMVKLLEHLLRVTKTSKIVLIMQYGTAIQAKHLQKIADY